MKVCRSFEKVVYKCFANVLRATFYPHAILASQENSQNLLRHKMV